MKRVQQDACGVALARRVVCAVDAEVLPPSQAHVVSAIRAQLGCWGGTGGLRAVVCGAGVDEGLRLVGAAFLWLLCKWVGLFAVGQGCVVPLAGNGAYRARCE